MKEIGGYIELDKQDGSIYHEGAVALNCGRAALEYLIRVHNIRHILLPVFCCDSITQPCYKLGIKIEFYHVGNDLLPILPKQMTSETWIYIINYYGQISNEYLEELKRDHDKLIIDNAQAYFQRPIKDTNTLYTCRKFFGVSDGAFLYTDLKIEDLPLDYSFERIHYVLGRFEKSAEEFYAESARNNENFEYEPIKKMSKLTDNMLRVIDYEKVRARRTENYIYLHNNLGKYNDLKLVVPDGAFMYPLYVKKGVEIRKALQAEKIFVPTLWPDVFKHCDPCSIEYDMAANILPLPIDQRYNLEDMERVLEEVRKWLD